MMHKVFLVCDCLIGSRIALPPVLFTKLSDTFDFLGDIAAIWEKNFDDGPLDYEERAYESLRLQNVVKLISAKGSRDFCSSFV